MTKSARKIDYLFHKNGSPNWYVRFQRSGKDVIESLRTADRLEAEAIAAMRIGGHKSALLAARPRIEPTWQHELDPGREHAGSDGSRIVATDRELIHIGHNGAIIRTEPNGGPALQISGLDGRLGVPSSGKMIDIAEDSRPIVPRKRADDAILETYIEQANVTGYPEREARAMWSLFRMLTNGIPIAESTRDDGRKLVEHLKTGGAKPATIKKKLMWLKAACNLAVEDRQLEFNPFAGIGPKRGELEVETRLPLSDNDVKECKRNLSKLSEADQLLFRLLATTGMRLSEAFQIDGEEPRENGCRFVIIGKKTLQSRRRVPLPADLLAHLPKTIKGPLFKGGAAAASKRLNRFLRDIYIMDPRKVIHSLRHRAQDRLRAAECPQDVRWALLGHEKKTVAAGYGEGFPVKVLRRWADKIGF
jgi:integrase